jgi:hypothetical protein
MGEEGRTFEAKRKLRVLGNEMAPITIDKKVAMGG